MPKHTAADYLAVRNSVWCVVRNSDGKYLLLKRSKDSKNPNLWNFPGGGVENGETPIMAGTREFHEECGVNISGWLPFLKLYSSERIMHYVKPPKPVDFKKIFINGESSKYDWYTRKQVNDLSLHHPTQQFFNYITNMKLLKFRKSLVKSNLFCEIHASYPDSSDVVAKALVCLPSRKLHNVWVDPYFRGHGVASALMQHVMADTNHPIALTANPDHGSDLDIHELVAFYSKFGFVPTESVANNLLMTAPVPMKWVGKKGS